MEPVFQVAVTKHTGGLFFWYNQRRTVTGAYPQCDAAIKQAQLHNLLFGWWSIASLLWNPISLWRNISARKALRQQAEQALTNIRSGGPPTIAAGRDADQPGRR